MSNEIINNYFSKFNYIILEKINISDNLAEYSYWIIVLAISLLISLPGFLSNSKTTRRFMIVNFILFLLLSFFAIFVDFIGINWDKWFKINLTSLDYFIRVSIEIIEECGELGIISLSCIWLFALNFPAKIKTP